MQMTTETFKLRLNTSRVYRKSNCSISHHRKKKKKRNVHWAKTGNPCRPFPKDKITIQKSAWRQDITNSFLGGGKKVGEMIFLIALSYKWDLFCVEQAPRMLFIWLLKCLLKGHLYWHYFQEVQITNSVCNGHKRVYISYKCFEMSLN